ncbi:PREDICTED: von Willebrand factor A domain-containing protein 7 isoform X4 [Condylura cristata]|uniref:von Willebrand factor A domain-containing protein 7 isoform X4 n=1 Tax=Condylura cristata TaxID=143302 RepID=UPI000643B244|nr:PREDICTED: von Willebrand factor A domain-containing protein 7 isoform X4 [Condylura cristata]
MHPTNVPVCHLGPSVLLLLQLLLPPASAFFPNIWSLLAAPGSVTHQDLTEEAALNVTLQLFLEHPPPGRPPLRLEDFLGRTLLADDLFAAYFGPGSPSRRFRAALGQVSRANAAQDFLPTSRNDPDLHFDAERLGPGRTRLVGALRETVAAARALDYTVARQRLGAALHALQDFYSHSNWVELGQQQPHPHLLWPRMELQSLAQVDDATCSDCKELSCPGNLLGFPLLTSGYFGTHPPKPPGKCSHGGHFDQSSSQPPRGGINKDSTAPGFSPHHMLHLQAAQLALLASIQALSLLQNRLGDKGFSRLLDITPASGLSFVLDTTGSMGEEINAAKIQARRIVDQRRGSPMEPSHYILVPFHDPGFGPVFSTSDPDSFWQQLNEIHALGGGDEPEMCLSAVEVTLPLERSAVVPGRPLVFSVDGLLQKVTVRIHGEVSSFWIRSPAGVSQGQEEGQGPLGHTRRFGQFWMVTMSDPPQTGTWEIHITAEGTPRVRVQAQTTLDFLFHFGIPVEDGPHPGLYPLTQPIAGLQTQLLVEVTGLGSGGSSGEPLVRFSHVVLRGVSDGVELGRVPLDPTGPPERGLLAAVLGPTVLPAREPFSLELIGQDAGGQSLHRVAPQSCTVAPILLELSGPPGFPVPGSRVQLSLRVTSFSGPQELKLRTFVNPGFAVTSNLSRAHLERNESAWGHMWLEVPDSAAPDSMVMVTVTATGQETSPVTPTHAFLRLLVLAPAPQDQHAATIPPHSPGPILLRPSPSFHPSTFVTLGRAAGVLAGHLWWGTVGGVLLLLGLTSC